MLVEVKCFFKGCSSLIFSVGDSVAPVLSLSLLSKYQVVDKRQQNKLDSLVIVDRSQPRPRHLDRPLPSLHLDGKESSKEVVLLILQVYQASKGRHVGPAPYALEVADVVPEDVKARLQDHLISDLAQTSQQDAFYQGLEMRVRSFS